MLRPYNGDARVCRVARGEAIEQIGFEEMDAIGNRMALGVAFGDGYGCEGNVGGVDCGATEFLGEGDGNAGGAGADIGDLQAFAGERLFAAGAAFADGEAVEGDFDDVLGFGAGDQHVGSDFKLKAPEFLSANEVLRRFASYAAGDECQIAICVRGADFFFRMGVNPGAVATEDVEEQQLRGKCVGRNVRLAQMGEPLLQCGSYGDL